MKIARVLVAILLLAATTACSLPPEVPVKKEQLYLTGVYSYYTIKESPESVLNALNKNGEVVLEAFYKEEPIYIKIMALSSGLHVSFYER